MYEPDRLIKFKPLGSGTSFRADACKDNETGTLAVLKTLRPSSITGDVLNSSVLQELKVSVYPPFLKHRNIVRTLGFATNPSALEDVFSVSLVMEFAELGSLDDYLARTASSESHMNWQQQEGLIIDICTGLEALHKCRVVHGDIKPANILIFPNDHSPTNLPYLAKLTDFGSSIVEDTIDEDIDASYSPPIYRGTPLYVPYYVRRYSGRLPFHVMPSVDVYSFGLLLWSICKCKTYYEPCWDRQAKGELQYIDEIGLQGLRQHFESDLEGVSRLRPEIETTRLSRAFMLCVKDSFIDLTPIAPIDREGVYREAFSSVTEVRRTLTQGREESR
jgi:serine/threonine protein kinase